MHIRKFSIIAFIPFALSLYSTQIEAGNHQDNGGISSAIVEPDCAPWDGPAFGLWIPGEELGGSINSWIYLRIWQQPEESAGTFNFPHGGSRQKGAVTYFLDLASPKNISWQKQSRQELKGSVHFSRISKKESVLGELDFISDKNVHLRGSFAAKWVVGKQLVCG